MSLGAPELIIILLIVLVLFGYKKLPDASRSLGRSLRIFKGEMKGMKEDDLGTRPPATDRSVPVVTRPTPPGPAAWIGRSPAADAQPEAYAGPEDRAAARSTTVAPQGEMA